ncbi:MAG: pilus assembly protein PilX [Ruminococcus sp.]|nr:pilus assembly protein PilX [Ruminococcus sp.]
MRKFNAFLSMGIVLLFLVHAVSGGFILMGLISGGNGFLSALSWTMVGLIVLHAIVGVKLTADTLIALKKAGTSYFKDNRLFWTRRISGFAVMLFILFHVLIFIGKNDGAYRLTLFGGAQLVTQILLVLSLAIHLVTNIRPLMTALGIRSGREFIVDAAFVLSVILLFTGAGFVVYYLRWNVF